MRSIKHPASLGNIFLFFGFIFVAYSSFVFSQPSKFLTTDEHGSVLADCDTDGPYGEPCIENESYLVEKKVKIEGGDTWADKVNDVEEDDTVLFRVQVTNVGDTEEDDFKMTDDLPDEMNRTGGDGLTEEWDNFEPDEEVEFIIESQLDEDEFDTETEFEKCVVNKAEVTQDGDDIGSDTATVCYGNADIEELPDTGPLPLGLVGVGLTVAGALLKGKRIW